MPGTNGCGLNRNQNIATFFLSSKSEKRMRHYSPFILIACIALFAGCDRYVLLIPIDTPAHHVKSGNRLMKNGKIEAAAREFKRAKELDPSFAPAHIGMGMAYGFQRKFEKALAALDTAGNNIKENDERIDLLTARMRIYLMGREKLDPRWLSVIETNFKEARNLSPNNPELYFFMGLAYKMSNDYNKAADQFSKVLQLDKGYVEEAERELKSYY